MSKLKKFLLSTLLILLSATAIITVSDGINILRGISAQPTSITVGDIIVSRPWADIRYYGASPSASNMVNTVAIQTAINSGLPVYIPNGIFNYDTTLTFLSNYTYLFGNGFNSQLVYTGTGVAFNINGVDKWAIKNLSLKGNSNATDGILIGNSTTGSHRWLIDNVQITNFSKTGAAAIHSIFGVSGTIIHPELGNIPYQPNYYGLKIEQFDANHVSNANTIVAGSIEWNTIGVYIAYAINTHIFGTTIEGNSSQGVYLKNTLRTLIEGVYMEGDGPSPNSRELTVDGGRNDTLIACLFGGEGNLAIYVTGSSKNTAFYSCEIGGGPTGGGITIDGGCTSTLIDSCEGDFSRIIDNGSYTEVRKYFNTPDSSTKDTGVILMNIAGTITKRVRLNNTGDGLVYGVP